MEAPPTLSTPLENQWSQPPVAPAPHWKPSDAPDSSKSFAEAMSGRPVHPASLAPQARASAVRFAPLSALPEGRGLPARRDEVGPSAPPSASITPRQLPGIPHAAAARQVPVMLPTALPAPQDKQIGFNCPSCMTILIIKQPTSYDGQPAPCPYCGVVILPPRVATPSPFKLLAPASNSQERLTLPGGGASARIPVGRPAPVAQPGPARKPGLPGAKSFARAAMF